MGANGLNWGFSPRYLKGWVFLCECLFAYAVNMSFYVNVKWEWVNSLKVNEFYFGLRFKKISDLLEYPFQQISLLVLVVAPGKVQDDV